MRDLILFLIIVPGGLIALRHPFVGAMLWTWISMMNPHRLTWGFMFDAQVGLFVGVCTLVGLLFSKEKRSPFLGTPVTWLVILIGWMCLTTIFAFNIEGSWRTLEKVLKIDLMVLVTLMLIRTRREMMVFAWVLTLSVAFYGIKGGFFTLMTGGGFRVYGPSGSYIEENNALAVALIMAVPMLSFLQTTLKENWQKYAMTVAMVLCAVSILGSHSRGALLAIGAMLTVLWWRGKNKLPTAIVMVLGGVVFLSFMPEEWWARMASIGTYEEDQSAMGRINAWWMAFNIAKDNFFGGGFSIYNAYVYSMYAPDPSFVVSAHSIYFHMMGEHGFIGLFIYLCLWLSTWTSAGWLRKHGLAQRETEWCFHLGSMIQVALVGFAVGGAFLSLTYYDLPYNLMALTVAARVWLQSGAWRQESSLVVERRIFGIPVFLGDRLAAPSGSRLQSA